jgi:hypothetical protein
LNTNSPNDSAEAVHSPGLGDIGVGVANKLCMALQPLIDNTNNVTRGRQIVCRSNSSRIIFSAPFARRYGLTTN